jgi:hypothetical protein
VGRACVCVRGGGERLVTGERSLRICWAFLGLLVGWRGERGRRLKGGCKGLEVCLLVLVPRSLARERRGDEDLRRNRFGGLGSKVEG